MRIPLDYYRILGVPIGATAEQIEQAYGDRALQQPRPEYSEAACQARQNLIEAAYRVLSDPERRAEYDTRFLLKSDSSETESSAGGSFGGSFEQAQAEAETFPPGDADSGESPGIAPPLEVGIEVDPQELAGALLILQESGEYELVRRLVEQHLSDRRAFESSASTSANQEADLYLTLALALRELGREQWQQSQYERAAATTQEGYDLLERADLFPHVRQEIETELYRLRPYRILELLAQPERKSLYTRTALQLLRAMLDERGGIEGRGDDRSGLGIDDFLRFIQQLRSYLSASEQQELFEAEARRPSAAATYLAAYARLARGFAYRQPQLVAAAQELLQHLGQRQDVYLEQSVCALLLGQTDQASEALELSQEYEPLAFIQKHSQGAPDLLPGLCLYVEQWLHKEVFPKFRDLANRRVSLKEYFADAQVQAELEMLLSHSQHQESPTQMHSALEEGTQVMATWPRETQVDSPPVSARTLDPSTAVRAHQEAVAAGGGTVVLERPHSRYPSPFTHAAPADRRIPVTNLQDFPPAQRPSAPPARPPKGAQAFSKDYQAVPLAPATKPRPTRRRSRRSRRPPSARLPAQRLFLLVLAGMLGMGVLGYLSVGAVRSLRSGGQERSPASLEGEQLMLSLNQPLLAIPTSPEVTPAPATDRLTPETAQQILQTWFASKSQALGANYQTQALEKILSDPLVQRWRDRAATFQRSNAYQQFQHQITANSVKINQHAPNRASIEASVREVANFYQRGQRVPASPHTYDSQLRVRYEVERFNGQWRIKSIQVLG